MEKIVITKNNIEDSINIINDAFKGKKFKIHLGLANAENPVETFSTNIPYYDNDIFHPPIEAKILKAKEICGNLVDIKTIGDCFPISENKNIIIIADNGNIYFMRPNKEVKRNQITTYEFKVMSA